MCATVKIGNHALKCTVSVAVVLYMVY